MERIQAIPDTFPLVCYLPYASANEPSLMIGMDSGVTNNAFTALELIQLNGVTIDFKYSNAYYF